jgi:DNA-binding NarL/FixJ family response regulator/signal transduction histidine kinase
MSTPALTRISRLLTEGAEELAAELHCERLIALSYVLNQQLLRTTARVGMPALRASASGYLLADFSSVERAIRTRQTVVLASPTGMPEELSEAFAGEIFILPVVFWDQVVGVLVGQPDPSVTARSQAWQDAADKLSIRAATLMSLDRAVTTFQGELQLLQLTRTTAAAILEGRPLHEVAELIIDAVAEHLRLDRVAIFTMNSQGLPRPVALRNVSSEYGEAVARISRQSPILARARATGLPYHARNVQDDARVPDEQRALLQREGIESILMSTLQQQEQALGALVAYPPANREFTAAELTIFRSLADKITLAIAINRQLERQRDYAMSEERNRLAREMHDTVAQSLAGLIMQIEATQTTVASSDLTTAREMLTTASDLARRTLEETRRAVQGLTPISLERLTLPEAIQEEARRFEEEEDRPVQFVVSGEEHPLTSEQSTTLLRIAQESLSNVRKHAEAHRVRVGLHYAADEVVLLVEDDGKGFDVESRPAAGPEGGYGLFGMAERVRLAGGELQIDSTIGWGTRIRAAIPYRSMPVTLPIQEPAPVPPRAMTPPPAVLTRPAAETLIRALIVDDHAMVRQGIRATLENSGVITVVGEATDGEQAVQQALALKPDVVLMDLQMPRVDGIEGTRRIHAQQPDLPVVILTTFATDEAVKEALAAGARGYLLKDTDPADLIVAVRAAHRGETMLSSTVMQRVATMAASRGTDPAAPTLNPREMEVLQLLALGARNKEIAAKLFITTSTVEYHLSNIYGKLNVSNRTEAVRAAIESGIARK